MKKLFVLLFFCAGCVSNMEEFSEIVKFGDKDKTSEAKQVTADYHLGHTTFNLDKRKLDIEWSTCKLAKVKEHFLLLSDKGFDFKSRAGFCTNPIVQAFLTGGFNVVAINLPRQGNSQGESDFFGAESVGAVRQVVESIEKEGAGSVKVTGVWGYSFGSITGAFFAKSFKGISWLMIGSGVYDLENLFKNDEARSRLADLEPFVKKQGDVVFESRSISWDYDGLPKNIYLYHGERDRFVSFAQVTTFRDALMAKEYRAKLAVLKEISHDIPIENQITVIKEFIADINQQRKSVSR